MSKSLDRVLQPDGSYKWEEVNLIHSTKTVEPVIEPVKKEALEVQKETIADFEGELKLGPPQIEKLDRYEFKAIYPDSEFLNLKIKWYGDSLLI